MPNYHQFNCKIRVSIRDSGVVIKKGVDLVYKIGRTVLDILVSGKMIKPVAGVN